VAEIITIKGSLELPHTRATLWPILARTDWLNRAMGLPPVNYEIVPLPEGGSRVTARAKMAGLSLVWREFPFEWTEPEFYQVRREFFSGPFVKAVMGLRLREISNGCAVEVFAEFTPRNFFGATLARRIVGPKMLRDFKMLIGQIGKHLTGQQRALMTSLPVTKPNVAALKVGLEKLAAENISAPLIGKLRQFLTDTPDVELSHIRPFVVARRWNSDRWEVLKLFLHATRASLLNLRWEILCPNCRATRLPPATSLAKLARTAHCDVCNIKFDAQFDQSVELKFSVHPSVRPCDDQTFCLAGPGTRPHIAAQIYLEPNEKRKWMLPSLDTSFSVRSVQVKEISVLPHQAAEIFCSLEKFEFKSGAENFSVHNPNAFPIQVALESGAGEEDILTAARVTNWQEFRDLFATEVISPTERIVVGSQVVLFTDLRGSTAMYSNIGDASAYALVRDHFKILHDVVSANHGGVVKTIGDAVMAVFSNLNDALNAARSMTVELKKLESKQKISLQLKCALHVGTCLAVNANERLDFFGSVVNLAARMVERSEGNDLVVTDEIFQRAETQNFLREIQQTAIADTEQFTGFPEPIRIWRILMPVEKK
jgi:adenylate cyclase